MAIYVFGYGALIHLKHIKELGKKERKSCPVMVTGLKRSLNVSGDRHLVYGVKDVKTDLPGSWRQKRPRLLGPFDTRDGLRVTYKILKTSSQKSH